MPQDQGDRHAAETRSDHRNPVGKAAPALEPVRHHRQAGRGQRRARDAAQNPQAEQELVVPLALGQQKQHHNVAHAAEQGDPSRPIPVKEWADPDSQAQSKVHKDGRDPTNIS